MLIHNGKPVPGTERVKEDIRFKPGMPNTRLQTKAWRGLGLHWTGGEGDYERVVGVLKERRLSVQLIGEGDGDVIQTADLNTVCAHIGSPGNDGFVGWEMASRGFSSKEELEKAKLTDPTLRDRELIDWEEPRDTYRDAIGGRTVGMAAFHPQMIENMVWLAEVLADYLSFPRLIPYRSVSEDPTVRDAVLAALPLKHPERFLVKHNGRSWLPGFIRMPGKGSTDFAGTFRGCIGHCHVHAEKYDPGTQPFYRLWAEGWNPAGIKIPNAY